MRMGMIRMTGTGCLLPHQSSAYGTNPVSPVQRSCAREFGNLESDQESFGALGIIAGALLGLSLVINVFINRASPDAATQDRFQTSHISEQQGNAAVRPLMRAATECIARRVAANPRFVQLSSNGDVGDLIVESITLCLSAVRALIHAHDEFFGDGTGESFFTGPFLDVLPATVSELTKSFFKINTAKCRKGDALSRPRKGASRTNLSRKLFILPSYS